MTRPLQQQRKPRDRANRLRGSFLGLYNPVKGKSKGITPFFNHKKTRKPLIHKDLRVARRKGFEPPTFWFVAKHSIRLSYRRVRNRLLRYSLSIITQRKQNCKHFLKYSRAKDMGEINSANCKLPCFFHCKKRRLGGQKSRIRQNSECIHLLRKD